MTIRTSNQQRSDETASPRSRAETWSRPPRAVAHGVTRVVRAGYRTLAGCWASDRGASALEYVLVFPMFFAIFLGTFYYGLVFATQSLMDNAARDGARLIRIGTLTGSSYSSALVTAVCNDLTLSNFSLIQNCSSNIQIYVAAAASGSPAGSGFSSLTPATVTNSTMTQTKATLKPAYDVLLQVAYPMPWNAIYTSGNAMLMSTQVFQAEPY